MAYLTVRETAEKWKISERFVQQYCVAGRIPGARKFGKSWAIPEEALRPSDPRRGRGQTSGVPMPLMSTSFVPGSCQEVLAQIQEPQLQRLARAEQAYYTGHAEGASREAAPLLSSADPAIRLSANLVDGFSHLTLGNIHLASASLGEVRRIWQSMDERTSPQLRAAARWLAIVAAAELRLPMPEGLTPELDSIRLLPPGLRCYAMYVQAHLAYLQGDFSRSIGIAEATLAMQPAVYPVPAVYLHLAASTSYMGLREPEQAKAHLLAAWELARPDDLIQGFAEQYGLLCGTLETVIKPEWPEEFKRIAANANQFSAGWRMVQDPESGHHRADDLTTTEFSIAMLAARGWSNKEIGAHMGISPNTVKQHISTIFRKLGITKRKEMMNYILR